MMKQLENYDTSKLQTNHRDHYPDVGIKFDFEPFFLNEIAEGNSLRKRV